MLHWHGLVAVRTHWRSISTRTVDLYKMLAVRKGAGASEIKSAYYAAAKMHHPDANRGDADSADRFRQLTEVRYPHGSLPALCRI